MTSSDPANVTWRKSARSSANGSDCVEVAEISCALAVRDSKDPDGPALLFDRDAWSSFVVGLRRGLRG
ncbi:MULTISPECIES: DUF397 domain-containing protein [unclassified Micromonospora]|uniref:DUF397 domain-containing protein n=1 Tax=unclassified Micromonospora TaxID=2617518 RepID=UPI00098D44F3|nr:MULTISPECIES: DUF397 domain-containing protein [unclassified Micromonospora]OON28608.1 DUF397 domain-containing protein [Micromonospora sp. Rc5]